MTADQYRQAMGPEFCAVADALRETFGDVKLVYLKAPGIQRGRDPSIDSVRTDGRVDPVVEQMAYWYGKRA